MRKMKNQQVLQYVIGDPRPPKWVQRRLMHYQKEDGTIACEIWGKKRAFALSRGDILQLINGRIRILRKNIVR